MQFAERFKCQKCGAWYVAMWERSPLRTPAPGTFNCADCGTLVHCWGGVGGDHAMAGIVACSISGAGTRDTDPSAAIRASPCRPG